MTHDEIRALIADVRAKMAESETDYPKFHWSTVTALNIALESTLVRLEAAERVCEAVGKYYDDESDDAQTMLRHLAEIGEQFRKWRRLSTCKEESERST